MSWFARVRSDGTPVTEELASSPSVVWRKQKHHRGSIYCTRWNTAGNLLATGSNDKTVKLTRFDAPTCTGSDDSLVIRPRTGTIRDLLFMRGADHTNGELLVTAGGGDFSLGVHDCETGNAVLRLKGHGDTVNCLATTDQAGVVCSASADSTVKLWDIRAGGVVASYTVASEGVTSVACMASRGVTAFGLATGEISLLDQRAGRVTHTAHVHSREVKSLQFGYGAHHARLLSGSYDNTVCVSQASNNTDMQYTVAAVHADKVISARWCPLEVDGHYTGFMSTSADRTARIWAPC